MAPKATGLCSKCGASRGSGEVCTPCRRAWERARYAANLETERARGRMKQAKRLAEQPEAVRATGRQASAKWRAKHPDTYRETMLNVRARRRNVEGSHSAADERDVYESQGWACANPHCEFIGQLTLDHIHPLSRGGSDWPDNLQGLCSPCNSSKNAADWSEWVAREKVRVAKKEVD